MRLLVISPQAWDSIWVCKQNYALALAQAGHTVFFLSPTERRLVPRASTVRQPLPKLPLFVVEAWIPPLALQYKWPSGFAAVQRRILRHLQHTIFGELDMVWSFDNVGLYVDLAHVEARHRLFFPVDRFDARFEVRSADLVVSVAPEIAASARSYPPEKRHVVPHGLNAPFTALAETVVARPEARVRGKALRIGYFGNLRMADLDVDALRRVIIEHGNAHFELFGPFAESRPGGGDARIDDWIAFLRSRRNCTLHGALAPDVLAPRSAGIDLWLLAYDPGRTRNGMLNSHKINEYLATGAPIVASWVQSLEALEDGLVAVAPRGDNSGYSALLADAVRRIETLDGTDLRRRRARHALRCTYGALVADVMARLEPEPMKSSA